MSHGVPAFCSQHQLASQGNIQISWTSSNQVRSAERSMTTWPAGDRGSVDARTQPSGASRGGSDRVGSRGRFGNVKETTFLLMRPTASRLQ